MTIDERIEALTQSVELLAKMHEDNEKRYARMFRDSAVRLARLEELMDLLTHIAINHDGRIPKLEGKRKK
jgi:hypothetical protein